MLRSNHLIKWIPVKAATAKLTNWKGGVDHSILTNAGSQMVSADVMSAVSSGATLADLFIVPQVRAKWL
jgi:hypothetical protein